MKPAFGEIEFMTLLTASYVGFLAMVCARRGLDLVAVSQQLAQPGDNTASAAWICASRAREAALHLLVTTGNVPMRQAARVVGLSPPAVLYALRRVENEREPGSALDLELEHIARTIDTRLTPPPLQSPADIATVFRAERPELASWRANARPL